jgi:hypothetical protein
MSNNRSVWNAPGCVVLVVPAGLVLPGDVLAIGGRVSWHRLAIGGRLTQVYAREHAGRLASDASRALGVVVTARFDACGHLVVHDIYRDGFRVAGLSALLGESVFGAGVIKAPAPARAPAPAPVVAPVVAPARAPARVHLLDRWQVWAVGYLVAVVLGMSLLTWLGW